MSLIIYVLCLLILSIFLNFKNLKLIRILLILFVIILISTNKWSNDYEGYTTLLYNTPEVYAEKGYQFLVKIIKLLNGNFRWVLYTIAILYLFIRKKTFVKEKKINVEILYLLYPLVIDLNQLRNTLMYFCFILAIYSKSKIKQILLLIMGISFQILGLVYFFINLLLNIKLSTIKKNWIKIYIIVSIFSFKLNYLINFLPENYFFYRIKIKLFYYIRDFNLRTLILWGSIALIDIFIFEYLYRKLNIEKIEDRYFFEKIYKIILLLSVISPLFTVVSELNRIYRNIFLLKYISISIYSNKINFIERGIIYFVLLFINILLLWYLDFNGLKIIKTIFSGINI